MKNFFEIYSAYFNVEIDDIEQIKKAWEMDSDDSESEEDDSETCACACAYVFTKGPRKNQSCSNRVNGLCYCRLHARCEKNGQKKNGSANPTNCKTRGTITNDRVGRTPKLMSIFIVKHRSHDFFWHPASGFVFDKKTRQVISIYSENSVSKLNEQDKKICKNYGFKVLVE